MNKDNSVVNYTLIVGGEITQLFRFLREGRFALILDTHLPAEDHGSVDGPVRITYGA